MMLWQGKEGNKNIVTGCNHELMMRLSSIMNKDNVTDCKHDLTTKGDFAGLPVHIPVTIETPRSGGVVIWVAALVDQWGAGDDRK